MPVVVKGFDGNPFDQNSIMAFVRFITTIHKLVLSGSYTAGGDTIDWTNAGVNSGVPAAQSGNSGIGPIRCDVGNIGPLNGIINLGGTYVVVPGTSLTNWKLKIFKTAGSEYSGAYLADALTDTILVRSDWSR